jgi:hypothetical protein
MAWHLVSPVAIKGMEQEIKTNQCADRLQRSASSAVEVAWCFCQEAALDRVRMRNARDAESCCSDG